MKGYTLNIIVAWKDSLLLLHPKQMKLFALITLKSLLDLYVAWFVYFWWLALFFGACAGPEHICPLAGSMLGAIVAWKLHYLGFVEFTLYVMARSSVVPKNVSYFKQFFPLRYSIVFICAFCVHGILLYAIEQYAILSAVLACMSGLFFLFFLDSEGGARASLLSLKRAFLLFLYNFPLFILVIAGILACSALGRNFYHWANGSSAMAIVLRVLYVLIVPLLITVITNLYIKYVHEDFARYFGEQGKGYHD